MREMTNWTVQACEEGVLTWKMVAMAALVYMSEADVADMLRANDMYFDEDEEEEE